MNIVKHESRCYECGKMLFGGDGLVIGDENPDTKKCPRSLCFNCVKKAYQMIETK